MGVCLFSGVVSAKVGGGVPSFTEYPNDGKVGGSNCTFFHRIFLAVYMCKERGLERNWPFSYYTKLTLPLLCSGSDRNGRGRYRPSVTVRTVRVHRFYCSSLENITKYSNLWRLGRVVEQKSILQEKFSHVFFWNNNSNHVCTKFS